MASYIHTNHVITTTNMTALHIQTVTVRYIFCNVPAVVHQANPQASAVSLFTFCAACPAKATCKAPRLHHPNKSEPNKIYTQSDYSIIYSWCQLHFLLTVEV
jgi:hypothetical protein